MSGSGYRSILKHKLLSGLRESIDRLLGIKSLKELHAQQFSQLDLLRNEIMLELRYGLVRQSAVPTRILNIEKYQRLLKENSIVLNIGAGHRCYEDMLNLDMRELPNVDVIADAGNIQLPEGVARGIFSAHVIEHFPQEALRRRVLPNWVSLLGSGGSFRAIVPDAESMMWAYQQNEMSFNDLRIVTFGLQEYEEDIHYTMFSRASIKELLEEVGLKDINFVATSRKNGLCLEMEVLAFK